MNYILLKFDFIIVMTKKSLSWVTEWVQKCCRNQTMNKKVWNLKKKWNKFRTKAQKSSKVYFIWEIWWPVQESERSVPLYPGELADMMFNTRRLGWVGGLSTMWKGSYVKGMCTQYWNSPSLMCFRTTLEQLLIFWWKTIMIRKDFSLAKRVTTWMQIKNKWYSVEVENI